MSNILENVWPEWKAEEPAIGRGSYGVVYRAVKKDHDIESYAAVKVISIPQNESELDTFRAEALYADDSRSVIDETVKSFVNEIRLMESFKGVQNIVSVEDYKVVEKENGVGCDIFIRMELLKPFMRHLADRQMTEEEVIKLGCDICTALELLEKKKVIHRDIKPQNIFVNQFGDYKLGDFGIARTLENTASLSQRGTFGYMAPEVVRGSEYDGTVDIYSLGMVLYFCLNKKRLPFLDTEKQLLSPFERESANRRRLDGEPLPAPCEASDAMAKVILRACAYEPTERFASPTEMKAALLDAKAGIAPAVKAAGAGKKKGVGKKKGAAKSGMDRKWKTAIIVTVIVALLAAATELTLGMLLIKIKKETPSDLYEIESNDSPGSATPVTLGRRIVGEISSATDSDWFSFDVNETSSIGIRLAPGTEGGEIPELALFRASGMTEIPIGDGQGGPAGSGTRLDPGAYYIRLNAAGASAPCSYTLTAGLMEEDGKETEPNDSIETAGALLYGLDHSGSLTENDTDIYTFEFEETACARISVAVRTEGASIKAELAGAAKDERGWMLVGQAETDLPLLKEINLAPGKYYLKLTLQEGSAADYTLNTEKAEKRDNAETELDRGITNAAVIRLGEPVYGSISKFDYGEDYDCYKFTLETAVDLEIVFNLSGKANIDNFTYSIYEVGTDDHDPDIVIVGDADPITETTCMLSPGTYYLRIEAWSGSGAPEGDYCFWIRSVVNGDMPEYEPNNTTYMANRIVPGTTYRGMLTAPDMTDVFAFYVEEFSLITIRLWHKTAPSYEGTAHRVAILNDRHNEIWSDRVRIDTEEYVIPDLNLRNGTYYLVIGGSSEDDRCGYSFCMDEMVSPPLSEIESNNNRELSTHIRNNSAVKASLGYEGDIDFFRFELEESSLVTLSFSPVTTEESDVSLWEMQLFSIDGAIGCKHYLSDFPSLQGDTIRSCLPAGNYWVSISKGTGYSPADYRLLLIVESLPDYWDREDETEPTDVQNSYSFGVQGQLYCAEDTDEFTFRAESQEDVRFTMGSSLSLTDEQKWRVVIYNLSYGETVFEGEFPLEYDFVSEEFHLVASAEYLVRIYAGDTYSDAPYYFRIN